MLATDVYMYVAMLVKGEMARNLRVWDMGGLQGRVSGRGGRKEKRGGKVL